MRTPSSPIRVVLYLFLGLSSIAASGQDTATVYFYRPEARSSVGIPFKIYHSERFLAWTSSTQAIRYVCRPGQNEFFAERKNGSGSSLIVAMQSGGIYYVKATIAYQTQEPRLEEVDEVIAKSQMESMTIEQIRNITPTQTPQEDTVIAVANLFYKKRHGGMLRLNIGLGITLASLYTGLRLSTQTTTTYSYNGPTQTSADPDHTGLGVSVAIGLGSALIAATGVAQQSRFGRHVQRQVLEDYKQGNPLPGWIKSKLTEEYFRH